MPEIVVAAESRTDTGTNSNRRLRAAGKIPGILYGAGKPPTPVAVSPQAISGILRSAAGSNTLFDLEIGGARCKVILKEYQLEPVRNRLLHADFYEVALDKTLEIKVHVELHGTPAGVKTQGGILDFVTRELEIACLPLDIPGKIEVDVSHLELGKHLRVSEIKAPDRVKILTDPDVVIANVVAPRAEEEVAPAAEAAAAPAEGEVAAAEPEVIKKGKAPEAEGEEKAERPERPERPEKKEKK
jgi:large subunit ribosomal protein L25